MFSAAPDPGPLTPSVYELVWRCQFSAKSFFPESPRDSEEAAGLFNVLSNC